MTGDVSDVERTLNNAVLLLPQGLAIYYVLALEVFHAPLEKVSWVVVVLSAYVGINLEDITDKRNKN
ncbi:MAG: hypothetical protein K2Y28_18070 [Burkholderiaceae bacterium]|nr:hypothetical protein [Burkholderiaceae bacterium]